MDGRNSEFVSLMVPHSFSLVQRLDDSTEVLAHNIMKKIGK